MTDTTIMPDPASFQSIGKSLVRTEDARLTTGRGRFSDDFCLDGQVYAVMVRSPHAHARILEIDCARAKAMPGVLRVFCGADALPAPLGPTPHDPLPNTRHAITLL